MLWPGSTGRRASAPTHVFMASMLLLGMLLAVMMTVGTLCGWGAVGEMQLLD